MDTDEVVAIKLVDTEKQMKLGLIVKELEALSMLKHQNIVNYMSSYLHGKTLWIVMEYLNGKSLEKTNPHLVYNSKAISFCYTLTHHRAYMSLQLLAIYLHLTKVGHLTVMYSKVRNKFVLNAIE